MKDYLFETAQLGIETEQFIHTGLGKYLVFRANKEKDEAVMEMQVVDPEDSKECRRIQERLNLPDKILTWIDHIIKEGKLCEYNLQEEEALS